MCPQFSVVMWIVTRPSYIGRITRHCPSVRLSSRPSVYLSHTSSSLETKWRKTKLMVRTFRRTGVTGVPTFRSKCQRLRSPDVKNLKNDAYLTQSLLSW